MRAVSTELNVEMISVKCSDVMSKWYGESEALAENMFKIAKERSPCILFLDEIDAIAKRRDFYATDDVTPRILSIMLSELDGMDEATGIVVVGATNMPDLVDPALLRPGRFDKVIYVPSPDVRSREEILRIHMRSKPMASDINIERIARRTEGFSGADLENLINESAATAMQRSMASIGHSQITQSDIDEVLDTLKPSISEKAKREYEKMGQQYSRRVPSMAARMQRKEEMKQHEKSAEVDYYESEVMEWE
jgi:SpoVK/Ycf46/Vps4 family AAA+-type ATPase